MTTRSDSAPHLSSTEWKVVATAYDDAETYRFVPARPSLLRQAIGKLTGHRPELPAADPRREALRRFVCTVRRTRRPDERQVPALMALGFNRSQVDALALLSA
ncbi:MAG: hypothetical protein V4618_10720 [Pseudomonadota bacterium]